MFACLQVFFRAHDPQRQYKRGYVAARQHVRQHPFEAYQSWEAWSGNDDEFDRGWDHGVAREIRFQILFNNKRMSDFKDRK